MNDPQVRVRTAARRAKIAWLLWALAVVLIAGGILVPYTIYREALPLTSELRQEISWIPLAESASAREYYLQTRKIGYDAVGRRVDEKEYVCTA